MRRDRYIDRAKLRGYLLEIIIAKLLYENGFIEINQELAERVRITRVGFIEFKGRGGWHQIDCPFDYKNYLPFINPIRLLAEVKFYKGKIQKNIIRESIGVLKDIQENYYANNLIDIRKNRYTELGVLFSASGFSDEAEMLAFAHNIKTISYNNVPLMREIIEQIEFIEERFLSCRGCISEGNQSDFVTQFKQLINIDLNETPNLLYQFIQRFDIPEGLNNAITDLKNAIRVIHCNFIANTSGGALMHFISDYNFPKELFLNTDTQTVQVYYEILPNNSRRFWMVFSEDNQRRRFYFNPPESLEEAAFWGGDTVLNEKERYFRTLHISIRIENVSRNLILILDTDWLDRARGANA
jgi:hypothetical protein